LLFAPVHLAFDTAQGQVWLKTSLLSWKTEGSQAFVNISLERHQAASRFSYPNPNDSRFPPARKATQAADGKGEWHVALPSLGKCVPYSRKITLRNVPKEL
jgi:hypothetical protein